jgi:hypothetical protein
MFESPISTMNIPEMKSALIDATQTASQFASAAVRKTNNVGRQLTARYESQINDFRNQMVQLVNKADETVTEIEDRFEPIAAMMTKRLPAPLAAAATMARTQSIGLRHKAHEALVDVLAANNTTINNTTINNTTMKDTAPRPTKSTPTKAKQAPTTATKAKPKARAASARTAAKTK